MGGRWRLGLFVVTVMGCGIDPFAESDNAPPAIDAASCDEVTDWDPSWTAFEDEVLRLTNEARMQGHDCGSEGNFGPAAPLTLSPSLRCAARLHSAYMADTGDFDHIESANDSNPFQRIAAAGYSAQAAGENIAVGQPSPVAVMGAWLDSDGHCRNIMDPAYTQLGVGYAVGTGEPVGTAEAPYWTQAFGAPQ